MTSLLVTIQARPGSFVLGEERPFTSALELAQIINARRGQANDWWTLNRWKGASRATGWRWLSASGVALDFDYRGKGEVWAEDRVRALANACMRGAIPGNALYRTPHGLRDAFLFCEPLLDKNAFEGAVVGAGKLLGAALEQALGPGLFGFDPASKGLDRIMYAPCARAKGVVRQASVVVLREDRCAALGLIPEGYVLDAVREAQDRAREAQAERARPSRSGSAILEAVEQYERLHGRSYSRRLGPCPLHRDGERCFKALEGARGMWICYSDHHVRGGRRSTKSGRSYWWGNQLDIDAALAGMSPVEMLIRAGLWRGRLWSRERGGAASAPTPSPRSQ